MLNETGCLNYYNFLKKINKPKLPGGVYDYYCQYRVFCLRNALISQPVSLGTVIFPVRLINRPGVAGAVL